MLPKTTKKKLNEWCDRVPVVGFNSARYDLDLIKEHFVQEATHLGDIVVGAKSNKTMFLLTKDLKFLDVINYLAPGVSLDAWLKAYGATKRKSWFPYEWLNSPEKLQEKQLPPHEAWYSKLKGQYLLTEEECESCLILFKEKEMQNVEYWLKHYNNIDVEPFLEALERMKSVYIERSIDILKNAVSIPGVSMKYVLRNGPPKNLYAPNAEDYKFLKDAVLGGPSLVFTRYHEAGVSQIRSHRLSAPKLCRKTVGYDANLLYSSTMKKPMPCGKEFLLIFEDPKAQGNISTENSLKAIGLVLRLLTSKAQGVFGPNSKTCLLCFKKRVFQTRQCLPP